MFICGKDDMYSLACEKLQRIESYKRHMIEVSLELWFVFWALKLQISQWCRIYKLGLLLNPNDQKMHHNPTQTSYKKKHLQWRFKLLWFDPLTINQPLCDRPQIKKVNIAYEHYGSWRC